VGHGLGLENDLGLDFGLEHDLGLGVGPSYKPWGGCITKINKISNLCHIAYQHDITCNHYI